MVILVELWKFPLHHVSTDLERPPFPGISFSILPLHLPQTWSFKFPSPPTNNPPWRSLHFPIPGRSMSPPLGLSNWKFEHSHGPHRVSSIVEVRYLPWHCFPEPPGPCKSSVGPNECPQMPGLKKFSLWKKNYGFFLFLKTCWQILQC